jgi:hypothetical protein
MRRVLPGGGVIGSAAACRPGAAVEERMAVARPARTAAPTPAPAAEAVAVPTPVAPAPEPTRLPTERLTRVKLAVEVAAGVVGLVGAVLALFGLSRR